MTSRIFVDSRGDGFLIAERLRRLGFIVDEFFPRQIDKPPFESYRQAAPYEERGGFRFLLSADDDLFSSKNRRSLSLCNDPFECLEAARLLISWRQHAHHS
jgi:hypothetical protein